MKKSDYDHKFDGKQDRNFHQKPFDEVTDPLEQIDDQSAGLAQKDHAPDAGDNQDDNQDDRKDEINESDLRDASDSSRDWEAENSRTSRHK